MDTNKLVWGFTNERHHLGSSMLRLVGLQGDPTQDTPNFKIGLGCLKMKNKGRSVLINSWTFATMVFWCSTATKHFESLQTCNPPNKKHNIAIKSTERHHHSHLQSNSTSIVDQSNLLGAITRCHALPKSHVKRYNCHHPSSISPGRTPPRCIKITPSR